MKSILITITMLLSFSLHAEREMDYGMDHDMVDEANYSNVCNDVESDFTVSFPFADKSIKTVSDYSEEGRTLGTSTRPHYGIDLGAKYGTDVLAAHDGVVTAAYEDTQWGNGKHVSLETEDGLHGSAYLHLSVISVSKGTKVKTGDKIGQVGNSGFVYGGTGVHLHFSYKVWCSGSGQFVYRDPSDKFLDYLAAK